AASLPLWPDGPVDAGDAVPRGVVPPRGRGDVDEGDRGRWHPERGQLRDRGPPADAEHVVSPRARDVRVGARRRPGEGRLQDVEEWRGAGNLHRRGPREGPGRERGDHPGEGPL